MNDEHLDFGALDALRRGEADEAAAAHLTSCERCQLTLAELEEVIELVRADAALPAIPDAIDKRIRWSAQQNAARVRRQARRRKVQRWAIAASVILSIASAVVWQQKGADESPVADTKLDIVDALMLARLIAHEQPADRRYDVNQDGRVDDEDVQTITRRLVALRSA